MQPIPTKVEARLSKTQESKRDKKKQPLGKQLAVNQLEEDTGREGKGEKEDILGKQHAVNQLEEDTGRGGKGEKEEETGREKN